MKKMFFNPETVKNYKSFCKVNNLNTVETNITERNYDYLLSLANLPSAKTVNKSGNLYIKIGDGDITANCPENKTVIKIDKDGIAIIGKTADAVSDGVKILIDMVKTVENDGTFPIGEFIYSPKIKFRGIHYCIFDPNDGTEKDDTSVESLRKRCLIASLSGYNYILLEFWGMFPYEKREYAHWKNCYSRKDVDGLISYIIDDLHMTPIPVQNLTSHAGWSRIASRRHVVLDQRPDLAYMWIPGGWCFAVTENDTKEYIKDIIDDLVKTFRNPPILHCSCDKCFGFGSAENERTQTADELFVNHLNFLHDELTKRGVKMAMWADMLYSSMDVKYWKCSEDTASKLPKDILMNIWTHNDIGNSDWKDISFFENQGYKTVYSPWINKDGAKNMVKQCLKHGSLGIIQTTWHKPDTAINTAIYTGAYMWNGEDPDIN